MTRVQLWAERAFILIDKRPVQIKNRSKCCTTEHLQVLHVTIDCTFGFHYDWLTRLDMVSLFQRGIRGSNSWVAYTRDDTQSVLMIDIGWLWFLSIRRVTSWSCAVRCGAQYGIIEQLNGLVNAGIHHTHNTQVGMRRSYIDAISLCILA